MTVYGSGSYGSGLYGSGVSGGLSSRTPATVTVEIAWTGQQTGLFLIDTSLLDGSDVLAGAFGQNVFDSITSDVKSVQISRGRRNDLTSFEQGRCVLSLKDPNGKYNPENASSPLHIYLDTHRPVRVYASHFGSDYDLFNGFISRIEHNPERSAQESTIEAVDFYEWLNAAKPTIGATGETTVGEIIGLLLDAVQWTDPSMRDLDTGKVVPDFSADGTRSALAIIQELLSIDLGMFFIDGSGVAAYIEGEQRWAKKAVDDTFDGTEVSKARPGIDKALLINRQTVTKTGGTAQLATANDGKPYYDGAPITSSFLASDTQAMSLALMIVALRMRGRPPTRNTVVWNRSDSLITKQLTREIGDRVTFSESLGGTDVEATIEGLAHELVPGGVHKTDYFLGKRPFDAFTLDQSELDGFDVLGY